MKNGYDWIHKLPQDFYSQAYNPTIQSGVKSKMAEYFDLIFRSSLASLISALSIPAGYTGDRVVSDLTTTRQLFCEENLEESYHKSVTPCRYSVEKCKPPKQVLEGVFERITWNSNYPNVDNEEKPSEEKEAMAFHWRHDDYPRPTVVCVHGFLATSWEFNNFYLGLKSLYDIGCDVVLKILPHHGRRNHPSPGPGGLHYVSGGIQNLNHSVIQSTYDIRSLIDYLIQEKGVNQVGLTGFSLGAYTASLMAGLDKRLSFVMPFNPIVSIPDAMMEWKPLDSIVKKIMQYKSLDLCDARYSMAIHSPLSLVPLLPADRLMIVAGRADRMASPRHAEALQKHWGSCDLHWFDGSHSINWGRSKTFTVRAQFLERIGFI